MILGEVEETVTTPEIDEETDEEIIRVGGRREGGQGGREGGGEEGGEGGTSVLTYGTPSRFFFTPSPAGSSFFPQTSRRTVEMLFVRGDVVILVSPPLRTA
jgi:hypothetical protein